MAAPKIKEAVDPFASEAGELLARVQRRSSDWRDLVPRRITREGVVIERYIREGRFQRSLALVTGVSGVLTGLEVGYEHYRGSYSQRIMYTPIILSAALGIAGFWGALSRRAARTILPLVSLITLVDGMVGFFFHIRGIARKPGGWRIPIVNLVMGPPVFAPLLFSTVGFLGLVASFLRRENAPALPEMARPRGGLLAWLPRRMTREGIVLEQNIREGRFQRLLPTQGSANPGLTIQALAARTADFLISNSAVLLSAHPGAWVVTDPPIRRSLSPQGTSGRGVPRFVSGTRKRVSR